MTERNSFLSRLASITLLAAAPFLGSACRDDAPENPQPTGDSTQSVSTTTPGADTATAIDSTMFTDTTSPDATGGMPGPGTQGPAWKKSELVAGVRDFINAIDSNDQNLFWRSLSARSIQRIERGQLGATRDEIWTAARQTLGDIQDRRITVIGGTRDSVALRIDGLRWVDSARVDDPVIVHLLLEENAWKVMYPGLLYPKHHLLK